MSRRIKLKAVFKGEKVIRRLKQFPGLLVNVLGQGLDDLGLRIVRLSRQLAKKDTGAMARSITMEKTGELSRKIGPSVGRAGRNDGYSYPSDVEYGTRPHWAPIQPIREWVWRNRAKFGSVTSSGRAASGKAARAKMESVAYAVQRAIARRGTQAHPFLHPAFDQVMARAKAVLTRYANAALRKGGGS